MSKVFILFLKEDPYGDVTFGPNKAQIRCCASGHS